MTQIAPPEIDQQSLHEAVSNRKWLWWPIAAVAVGVVAMCGFAWAAATFHSSWQYGVYASSLVAMAGLFGFYRTLSQPEREWQRELDALKIERERLTELQQEFNDQVAEQMQLLNTRKQSVAEKMRLAAEWWEFPHPVDLSSPEESPERLSELAVKDRQVMQLLQQESELLFERIAANRYSRDDQFDPRLLRDDAFDLMTRVARIYQPDSKQPLLETSIEQLSRATSRASLHLLVVLEQMPLNVKHHNLHKMYRYVRRAVKGYGAYKSIEPYLPYLNSSVYVGRLIFGANPLSLGAWWAASQLGTRGAKALTKELVNRQAIGLMHDVVRVLGCEVANIYGGDFRHRDANWVYGQELSALLSLVDLEEQTLLAALQEITALQLRNEYDRIYLYRCLAAHRAASKQTPDVSFLLPEERKAVAERINKFQSEHLSRFSGRKFDRWKKDFTSRLMVDALSDLNEA